MTDALRYEITRLRTIRSTYWILGVAFGFQLLLTVLIAWNLPETGPLSGGDQTFAILVTVGATLGVAPLFIAYVIGLLGVFSMGHEYRHGMIRATLTALPSRLHVMLAKVLTTAVLSLVAALVCVGIALLSAVSFGVGLPSVGGLRDITVGTVLYTTLFSLSGLAFATLTRNQTAAVALLLLVPSLVEGLVKAVVLAIKASSGDPTSRGGIVDILKFLPYDAGGQMYTRVSLNDAFQVFGYKPFGAVGGGITMAVFVVVLLVLATAAFQRRDA
ncbi:MULTISPECIES: ABC transporter permease [unclassified Aeromicrobium]|jgi:ABC-2 type transport system permease protein|uniref:ABC transporter permease n=1 Tax=unclassified Aeromicrobium TaxID=2633570 RepID=UPI0020985916|nr:MULTISPECIES: ABC transporter permease [unclassified Aeromicrobium]MCO7238349.1 ABC transporter permease [Aeromicrobium sp. CnD17-E]MDR6117021.1 ABC-2 type transport system permease protein [Aeromicrobium sp. SORGH_AS_0981]